MIPHIAMIRLKVDPEGFLDLNELETLLSEYNQKGKHGQKRIRLMAMCGASNVLGVFNNLEEISRIVHRYGVHLLVDAAQLVAHRRIGIEQYGIDYLAFSAHKVYAPFGCGVLVARKGLLNFSPAELDMIQSSGEENQGGIAGLGKALLLLQRIGLDLIREEEQSLTSQMLNNMLHTEGIRIYGIKDPKSPGFYRKGGVIVFELKGMLPNVVSKKLAEQGGIGVRYGCHCAHLLIKHLVGVPPFFERLQGLILLLLPRIRLPGFVRVSLGIANTEEDIAVLTRVLGKIIWHHRTRDHGNSTSGQSGTLTMQQKDFQQQMKDFIRAAAERVYPQL
jgi:selenocysteine lyase/cysteine desulfurase